MRARFWWLLVLLLTACTRTKTTPPGKLGAFDYTANLPAGVVKPADSELVARSAKTTVCNFEPNAGPDVEIRWKTFQRGEGAYIASAEVELLSPAKGIEVTVHTAGVPVMGAPGSKGYLAVATLYFQCSRKTVFESYILGPTATFDATGKLIDDPKTLK